MKHRTFILPTFYLNFFFFFVCGKFGRLILEKLSNSCYIHNNDGLIECSWPSADHIMITGFKSNAVVLI